MDGDKVAGLAADLSAGGTFRPWLAARRLASLRSPAAVRALAEAYASSHDERVVTIAQRVLVDLDDPECVDALCELVMATGDGRLGDLVADAGYLQSDPTQQALQLFLAGDFDRYAALDFDGSLLAAARSVADESLRIRLTERARVDWVHAVVGAQHAGAPYALTDAEWESALGILTSARRWEDMWQLATQAPPVWGVRLLKTLGRQRWRPTEDTGRAGFDELVDLAQGCSDDPVRDLVATLPGGHRELVVCLAATPDGSLLAGGSEDGMVRLWHLPSGEVAGVLEGHDGGDMTCLAVTPDGSLLAGGSDDGVVRLWHLPSGAPAGVIVTGEARVTCLAVAPDGELLASVSDDGVVPLWRLPSGAPAGVMATGEAGVTCMAATPGGSLVISGYENGTVHLSHPELWMASGTPVDDIDPAKVVHLADAAGHDGGRRWAQLISALVRWRRRYDVEVTDPVKRANDTDIEVGG